MRRKLSNLTTRGVEKETGKDLGKEELKLSQLDLALKYRDLDICVIPVHYRTKIAAIDWKPYETKMSSKDEIKSWFTNNKNYNIGIVLGKVSSCFEIDIDGQGGKAKFDQVFPQLDPNLQSAIKNTMCIVSPNGLKLLFRFRSEEWPEGIKTTKLWNGEGDHDGIELRANGSYSLGIGSVNSTGATYTLARGSEFNPLTLLKPEIEELVNKISDVEEFEIHVKKSDCDLDLDIVPLGVLEDDILVTLANNAKKYYKDGSKNDFTLGFCGQLRRLGVRYEDVYKIVYVIDPSDVKNINRIKYVFKSSKLAGKKYLAKVLKEQGLDGLEILTATSELFGLIEQLKKERNNKKPEENNKEQHTRANKASTDYDLEAKFKIVEKKPPADILYNLARTTILEQFQDQDTGEIYAVYEVRGHKEVHNMESAEFEYFLRQQFEDDYEKQQNKYFKAKKEAELRGQISEFLNNCKEIGLKIYPHGIIISKEHLTNTVQQLKASVTEKKKLYLRSFYENGILRYDLMDDKWRYVEINGYDNSVKICEDSYQYFKRYDNNISGSGSHAQVEPVIINNDNYNEAKKTFDNLIDSFNILSENEFANDKKLLLKVYWIAVHFNTNPKFPMPIPCASGPYGSAKSTLLATIKYHVDPIKPVTELLDNWGQQNDQRRRGLIVSRNYLTYFDNMSHLTNEESDELCLYATGSKYQERKLHTNTDIVKYHIQANIGYNGINDLAKNPDLLSRILHFELGEIENKIPFILYWKQREIERPVILGYIFYVAMKVIRRYETEKQDKKIQQTNHRLADFVILGEIIAQELGEKPGRFTEIFQDVVAEEQNTKAIENDSFAQILIEYIFSREYTDADRKPITKWETAPTSLHSELTNFARSKNYKIDGDWDFPHSPVALGKKFTKLKPALLQAGIRIERKEDRASTKWIIEILDSNKEEGSKVATA
jgi:hypothetical protein